MFFLIHSITWTFKVTISSKSVLSRNYVVFRTLDQCSSAIRNLEPVRRVNITFITGITPAVVGTCTNRAFTRVTKSYVAKRVTGVRHYNLNVWREHRRAYHKVWADDRVDGSASWGMVQWRGASSTVMAGVALSQCRNDLSLNRPWVNGKAG